MSDNAITAKTPWAGHTGGVPLHIDYFKVLSSTPSS